MTVGGRRIAKWVRTCACSTATRTSSPVNGTAISSGNEDRVAKCGHANTNVLVAAISAKSAARNSARVSVLSLRLISWRIARLAVLGQRTKRAEEMFARAEAQAVDEVREQ
jgi:hypothetical protein